jgi:hypothetical protein
MGTVLGLLVPLLLAILISTPSFPHTPEGWGRWQSSGGQWVIWLPAGAGPGEQQTFLLLGPGDQQGAWAPVWLGGGEIRWEGTLQAGGLVWEGIIADDGVLRGLVAESDSGWSLGALAPAPEWQTRSGPLNAILRGAP